MSRHCGLAIEAATEQFGLAACCDGRSATWQARPAREETQRVYAHAARLLGEVGATYADLEFVALGCGPGSFTGVRIAAAAAQAIAFARAVPVCRVSSLAVLAAGAARALQDELVATCLDARMDRAYLALYRVVPGSAPQPLVGDTLVDPREYRLAGDERFVAVGDGWRTYPALLQRHDARVKATGPDLLPAAGDLLQIATGEFRAGRTVAAYDALPQYLGQGPVTPRA